MRNSYQSENRLCLPILYHSLKIEEYLKIYLKLKMLSGIKDVDREILKHVDEKDLLKICTIDKKTWNDVCDDNFLKRRLARYSEIEKYKLRDETWKEFFLRFVYYTSKLFDFKYTEGDFKEQYNLFKNSIGLKKLLMKAVEKGQLPVVKYVKEKGFDIHIDDELPLKLASNFGKLEIVKYLVELGANIHASEDVSLIFASTFGH